MTEQKKDSWSTLVAFTTALMAVLAAITTLYVGKFSSRTILLQAQESDQWNYYQAKSIKSHNFELQKELLELELLTQRNKITKEAAAGFEKAIVGHEDNLKRYDKEKKEIKAKAEDMGKSKETSQRRAGIFGFALIFLQIGIMLSSISVITKKKPLWFIGLGMAVIAAFYFLDGLYLFY
jgi:uncharacterized protein DUF4337